MTALRQINVKSLRMRVRELTVTYSAVPPFYLPKDARVPGIYSDFRKFREKFRFPKSTGKISDFFKSFEKKSDVVCPG